MVLTKAGQRDPPLPPFMEKEIKKIYCYVDESGQDTKGELFLVALVVTGEEWEQLMAEAERIEKKTGKSLKKWRRAVFTRKVEYIREIFTSPLFAQALHFANYENTSAYLDLTILATARAILLKAGEEDYKATVIVDGLRDREAIKFASSLRHLRIGIKKVRGMKDESNPLLRVADAVCGFLRDYLEGQKYTKEFEWVFEKHILKEIKAK